MTKARSGETVALELEGMRYFYRAYPLGTLRLASRRQFPELRLNPDGVVPVPDRVQAPILFMNGAWQPMDAWLRHAAYANRFAPVILMDPPGNGAADAAPAHHGLELLESAMRQVLEAERVSRVNLLGFSYGTALAFGFAQSHPERVHRVALAGTMARVAGAARDALRQALGALRCGHAGGFADWLLNHLRCRGPHRLIANGEWVDRIMRHSLRRVTADDYRKYEQNVMRLLIQPPQDLSRRVDAPVLVFTGEHDVFTPPDGGRELAGACSRAAFTTIRGADHFSPIEQPRAAMDLALNFFRGRPLDGVPGCAPVEYFGRDVPDGLLHVA